MMHTHRFGGEGGVLSPNDFSRRADGPRRVFTLNLLPRGATPQARALVRGRRVASSARDAGSRFFTTRSHRHPVHVEIGIDQARAHKADGMASSVLAPNRLTALMTCQCPRC